MTVQSVPQYGRLRKLAFHLLEGEMGHEKFDFCRWNEDSIATGHPCGTSGCAIGECPIVFPRQWKWVEDDDGLDPLPGRRKRKTTNGSLVIEDAADFFNISQREVRGMFTPEAGGGEEPTKWNTQVLGRRATKYEVAAGILNYIAWKQNEIEEAAQRA